MAKKKAETGKVVIDGDVTGYVVVYGNDYVTSKWMTSNKYADAWKCSDVNRANQVLGEMRRTRPPEDHDKFVIVKVVETVRLEKLP